MSQFRPLPSFKTHDVIEEQSPGVPGDTPSNTTSPLILQAGQFPGATTGQLTGISNQNRVVTTGQLAGLSPALPVTSTTGRILRIPGSGKPKQDGKDLSNSKRRLGPRLRYGIICTTILLVMITTLISLAPLDNGQSAIPLVTGISNWVHAQQLNWQLQAHTVQGTQNAGDSVNFTTVSSNLPSMSLPKSEYVAIAQQDAINVGISPVYFVRQINKESGFSPTAVSPAGAVGIAQFEPSTAATLGIDPWDPIAALNAAAHLMASYNNTYHGDYAKALAAYNSGGGTVQYAVNAGGANWMSYLPAETRNYIYQIMGI